MNYIVQVIKTFLWPPSVVDLLTNTQLLQTVAIIEKPPSFSIRLIRSARTNLRMLGEAVYGDQELKLKTYIYIDIISTIYIYIFICDQNTQYVAYIYIYI